MSESNQSSQRKARVFSPTTLARRYLESRGYVFQDHWTLRFWREDFYRWTGAHYEIVPRSDLRADTTRWLQGIRGLIPKPELINCIMTNVEGLTLIPAGVNPPAWLESPPRPAVNLIPTQGSILDVGRLIAGDAEFVQPSSPKLFSLASAQVRSDGNLPQVA